MTGARLVAIVGMTGSGKSEVAAVFESQGYRRLRFGDITDDVLRERKLQRNEQNERLVREGMRKQYGMSAYAILLRPKIKDAIAKGNTVLDGLYSWEEYKILIDEFPQLKLVAVYAPRNIRYERLAMRPVRPLTFEESRTRDYSEIENLNKGGPIAMADFTILNVGSQELLKEKVVTLITDFDIAE